MPLLSKSPRGDTLLALVGVAGTHFIPRPSFPCLDAGVLGRLEVVGGGNGGLGFLGFLRFLWSTYSHGCFGVDAFRVGWVCFCSTSHSVIGSVMVGIRGGMRFLLVQVVVGFALEADVRDCPLLSSLSLSLIAGGEVVSRSTGGGCGGLHRGSPCCVSAVFCFVFVR